MSNVALSADGSHVAAAVEDHYVYLLDRDGKLLWKHQPGDLIQGVAVNADGSNVAAGSAASCVYLMDRDGKLLWKYEVGRRERKQQQDAAARRIKREAQEKARAEAERLRQAQEERRQKESHSSGGAGQRNSSRRPAAQSPYEVLGVLPGATEEELRSAYRLKASQNHPDKVAELDPEIRELAERRMKAINTAYEELKGRNAE